VFVVAITVIIVFGNRGFDFDKKDNIPTPRTLPRSQRRFALALGSQLGIGLDAVLKGIIIVGLSCCGGVLY